MKTYIINTYGEDFLVTPTLGLYDSTDYMGNRKSNLAICLDCVEDGYRTEPYGTITVNLGEFIGTPNAAYIDTSNNPGIEKWLVENGMGEATQFHKASGFVDFPLFIFDEQFLREIDDCSVYEGYLKQYEY